MALADVGRARRAKRAKSPSDDDTAAVPAKIHTSRSSQKHEVDLEIRTRESTNSPSAQLVGAVRTRPGEIRSPSPSRSRRASHDSSRASTPSQSRSRSQSARSRTQSRPRDSRSHSAQPAHPTRSDDSDSELSSPPPEHQPESPDEERPDDAEPDTGTAGPAHLNGETKKPNPRHPNYQHVLSMRVDSRPVSQVRVSPDGLWIASASADGMARIWDAATGELLNTLVGHVAGLSCLAWSPDSSTLATGSDDKSIRLWDRLTAQPAHSHSEPRPSDIKMEEVLGESYAAEQSSRQVMSVPSAAANAGRAARRRMREGIHGTNGNAVSAGGVRGTCLPLLGHHNYVYCLAFSPKGNILASGSYDEAVFLWDVRAGRLMRSLPAHSDPVSGIDFCCDGTLVVSCSTDGLIRIWDTATGQCLRTLLLLNEDNPAVSSVCFSPNGRYVLAFNLDSCARLWDYVVPSPVVKKTYQGHTNKKYSIGGCFGVLENTRKPIKPFIAAASEDGDVLLWDVETKVIVQRLHRAHRDGVCFWVDVCGPTMVSCGQDGWIHVYRHEDIEGDDSEEEDIDKPPDPVDDAVPQMDEDDDTASDDVDMINSD